MVGVPDPDEVIRFFTLLEDRSSYQDLDLPGRLQEAEIAAIRVRVHDPLEDRDDDEVDREPGGIERHPEVQALFERDSVRTLAGQVAETGSPQLAAVEFVELYRAAYGQVADGDTSGLERVVQTFVDAFFQLDHEYRAVVFESIGMACEDIAAGALVLARLARNESPQHGTK